MKPRHNPFATRELLKVGYLLSEEQWKEIMSRLKTHDYRAAVVGPHGSGKTTFLEGLIARKDFPFTDFYYCSSENQPVSFFQILIKLLSRQFVIVDGFQELGRIRGYCLSQAAKILKKGLVVSQHEITSLPVLLETKGTRENLMLIIEQLNDAGQIQPEELQLQAEKIFLEENANLREILLRLYDYCAGINCEQTTRSAD